MRSTAITFLILFLIRGHLPAQILEPAKWSLATSVQEASIGDEIELIFNVVIDNNWYLYSSDFDPDLGPMVTEFQFETNDTYQPVGGIQPVNPKRKYDDIWGGEYTYFKGKAQFRQKVRILKKEFYVKGTYSYQVCSDIDGKCIPFDDDFEFNRVIVKESQTASSITAKTEDPGIIKSDSFITETDTPSHDSIFSSIKTETLPPEGIISEKSQTKQSLLTQRSPTDPYSLLAFMVIAFLGGLAALFTPCVFPMIPMTVTFFTGKAKSRAQGIRNALLYGIFIVLIYSLTGALIAPFMGPEAANVLATHWIPNVLFFLVFIIFALSFFGLFEITLPASFVNRIDQKADRGGLAGIFFMALTLVLVSFSCTGPIVGSILVESAGGLVLKPVIGMLGFSLAFAIPFTLFAIFPEWLSGLPKSGGWLNSVKVILGFLELALSLKFLSVADQAYHWGLLDREVYLALWIVIFTLMGFYILGKIRLPHDSKVENIGVTRLLLSVATFAFVIYLIPGLVGAPLKGLSGYLPPMTTLDFNVIEEIRLNSGPGLKPEFDNLLCDQPKYADFLHFPHGIQGYFDYRQALQCAKEKNKPLFIDFTGHGCVNCREMEARVWSDKDILNKLTNDFVMVALYVDDKTTLPESDWFTSSYDGKVKKSIGKQNADFQISRFNNNAQPFYVILDTDENLLIEPRAYNLNIPEFSAFLEQAKSNFRQRNPAGN